MSTALVLPHLESIEWKILTWLGFDGNQPAQAEVIVSAELIEQILRVANRASSKDWAGSIASQKLCIFCNIAVYFE